MTARALRMIADAEPASRYLHPGEVAVSATPLSLSTVLGSCVGVCLFDAERGVGGMNHFLLPDSAGHARPNARFGDVALEQLLADVLAAGARRHGLAARVYGGACVLLAFAGSNHLGERNVQAALEFLDAQGIPVLGCDTGGRRGRRLLFHTHTGAARAQRI